QNDCFEKIEERRCELDFPYLGFYHHIFCLQRVGLLALIFLAMIILTPFLLCRSYILNVWDVGGQKSLRAYWKNYYEDTDGLVFVVDSCDKLRLLDCKNQLQQVLGEERLLGATLLIL